MLRPVDDRAFRPSGRFLVLAMLPIFPWGQLVISESSARAHVQRILTKLRLCGRVQAVVFAYQLGLVTDLDWPDGLQMT